MLMAAPRHQDTSTLCPIADDPRIDHL